MSDKFNDEFEDAMFRLMLEKVAYTEGEKLKNDPSSDIPKDVQDRCLKQIRKEIKRRDRRNTNTSTRKVLRFIPIAVVTAMFLGLFAYAAFPNVRTTIKNILLEKNPEYISWRLDDTNSVDFDEHSIQMSFLIDLPDEFQLVDYKNDGKQEYAIYQSIDNPDLIIRVGLSFGEVGVYTSNLEDTDYYEEFKINGNDAVMTYKDETIFITWWQAEPSCIISFHMTGNNITEAKQIVKSIEISK